MDIDRLLGLSSVNNALANEAVGGVDNSVTSASNVATHDDATTNNGIGDAREPAAAMGQDKTDTAAREAGRARAAINKRGDVGGTCALSSACAPATKVVVSKRPWIDTACLARQVLVVLVAFVVSIVVVSVMRPQSTLPAGPGGSSVLPCPVDHPDQVAPTPSSSTAPCPSIRDERGSVLTGLSVGKHCLYRFTADVSQPAPEPDTTEPRHTMLLILIGAILVILVAAVSDFHL
nr:hypothetical protein [Pandoravirus belohorizontensis]